MSRCDPISYFVHPTATIDFPCSIGKDTKIWHYCHISSEVTIGECCIFGQNVYIASKVTLGNRVKIQNNVSIYEGVHLEDEVFCGPSVVFTNVKNPRAGVSRKKEYLSTTVQRGATLGANATILCGIKIGMFAFVGAGAVITKDVPPHAVMIGNPAKQSGWACECGERLVFLEQKAVCSRCGLDYLQSDEGGILKK